MKALLLNRLFSYMLQNNPDLVFVLQEEQKVSEYLEDKVSSVLPLAERLKEEAVPDYLVTDECMEALTKDLRPSKYHYLVALLQEDFTEEYFRLWNDDALVAELSNIISINIELFENFGFSEHLEPDPEMVRLLKEAIRKYFSGT